MGLTSDDTSDDVSVMHVLPGQHRNTWDSRDVIVTYGGTELQFALRTTERL